VTILKNLFLLRKVLPKEFFKKEALVNRNLKVAGIELSGGYLLVKDISEVNNDLIIRIYSNSRNRYDKLGM